VRLELPTNTPIVLLREKDGDRRQLPIFIGQAEANAIALALEGIATPRPMTHDLFTAVLGLLDATIERVVVTHLENGTFFAELHLRGEGGQTVVSSRPSDAVALAVRTGSPIFASEALLDEMDVTVTESLGDDGDEVVEQFREFIETVDPEDFAS
jgi:bifunctional DNase/RNase